MNKIIQGDCLEVMQKISTGSVDLVVTSPPYNLGNGHHTGNKRHNPYNDNLPEAEYQQWQINVLRECSRVLSDGVSILYNHKNRIKNGAQITPYEWLLRTDLVVKQELVWFNGSQNFDKIRFYPMTERIYWLAKSPKTKLSNVLSHHDLFKRDEWQAVGTNKQHTRAFPEKMVEDLLRCFPSAKTILDPFLGSGTTAVAAKKLGRNYIGIELNEEYFRMANERLANA